MSILKRLAEIGILGYLLTLIIGAAYYFTYNDYLILGYMAYVSIGLLFLIAPYAISEKVEIIAEKIIKSREIIAIEDIVPLDNLEALKPARFRLKIRNPLKTYGVRLRFRSYDYINPSSLDLFLAPGETTEQDIIIVPAGTGRREFSVAIAPLFDENNNLIPSHEADDVAIQKFAYEAEEPAVGVLSSRERSILSSIIRFAIFFSASGLVYLSILKVSGMETLIFILTQVIPLVLILQVPALMLLFYLDRKLPEKPSFIFEEE